MTSQTGPHQAINRRSLFRGGAVVAGAAGATALGAAIGPSPASAADGQSFLIGAANTATAPTSLSAGTSGPALTLANTDGPVLALGSAGASWDGKLKVGEIASTPVGPVVGVDLGSGPESVYLATSRNLADLPVTFTVDPVRLLDTRKKRRPWTIVDSSKSALDSKGRLRANAWIDVAIAPAGLGWDYSSVFANVAVISPTKNGYLVAYPPGVRPETSTVNYQAGRSVANGLFMSVNVVDDFYALRLWASSTTHVLLDVTAVVVRADNSKTVEPGVMKAARDQREHQAKLAKSVNAALAEGRI